MASRCALLRRPQGAPPNDRNPDPVETNRARQAIGRSRGGLSTKVHALVDGRGLPLAAVLTAGQAGDNPQLLALLTDVRVPRLDGRSARSRPNRLVADKAYSHPSTRALLRRRGITATIPQRSDQVAQRRAKGSAGGRPYAFDQEIYRRRNVVERYFNRLKQWRGIATRYDKTAQNYRGGLLVAGLILWTRT